jgi:uncharacterized membrane protein
MARARLLRAHLLHDLGLFAWFGGSLMGVVGLHGASTAVADPRDRITVPEAGWRRFQPVQLASILAYWLGAAGLARNDADLRPAFQRGIVANDVARISLAVSATAFTAVNAYLGRQISRTAHAAADGGGTAPVAGATTPAAVTPPEVASAQRRQHVVQWATPAATGAVIVLAAQRNQMERPDGVLRGVLGRAREVLGAAG